MSGSGGLLMSFGGSSSFVLVTIGVGFVSSAWTFVLLSGEDVSLFTPVVMFSCSVFYSGIAPEFGESSTLSVV